MSAELIHFPARAQARDNSLRYTSNIVPFRPKRQSLVLFGPWFLFPLVMSFYWPTPLFWNFGEFEDGV